MRNPFAQEGTPRNFSLVSLGFTIVIAIIFGCRSIAKHSGKAALFSSVSQIPRHVIARDVRSATFKMNCRSPIFKHDLCTVLCIPFLMFCGLVLSQA